ncbi:MAG TPA: response regulator [Terriglobia bacterium]|nr:response regulator [Terriglobia bacterium]
MTDLARPAILLVDDEEMIVTSIKSFLAVETDYHLLAYTSPLTALQDLEARITTIDLAISDYLMPEMDGISFLADVKRKFPLAPRILLTGYADKGNAIQAINRVGLYQYIEKPWNNDDLRLVIHNGLEKAALLRQLEEKVHEVERVHKELNDVQREILRVFV